MPTRADLLSTHDVAHLLGVEERQVRALAEKGHITRVAHGIYDRTSAERYRAQRGSRRTRTWAEHTAWGAVALLSDAAPLGLGDAQRYRLHSTLLRMTDPTELVIRMRDRATVTTWSGHRSVLQRLSQELVVPGRRRLGLVENPTAVDGYLGADQTEDLVRRYHLREDATGPITLRSTRTDLDVVQRLSTLSRTLAAVDAATSLDPRERGAGERVLERRLELLRDNNARG